MTGASLAGLFVHNLYRDNTWAKAAYRGTDLATLLFAVLALLIALALARRAPIVPGPCGTAFLPRRGRRARARTAVLPRIGRRRTAGVDT